jgi:DNA polymerase (family X)
MPVAPGGDASGRPRSGSRAEPLNADLADALQEVGDLLELKGDQPFRVSAYRRAAESVRHAPEGLAAGLRGGRTPPLPGVGPGIRAVLVELATTGRANTLERLREEVPESLIVLRRLPGVGPVTARRVWHELGVTSLDELAAAVRDGRLRQLRGMGPRTAAAIAEALAGRPDEPVRELRMAEAHALAEQACLLLGGLSGAVAAHPVGDVRRMRETVSRIDVLIESDRPAETEAALRSDTSVARVLGTRPEALGASVILDVRGRPRVDVTIVPAGAAGTAMLLLTGSDAHAARVRERAAERGWHLDMPGARPVAPASGRPAVRALVSEPEVYAIAGLPFIPPELREDRGELEAALDGSLPQPVALEDLQGDCHAHSDWSDGHAPIEALADAARRRGLSYLALTDHSQSLTVANGLSPAQVELQRRVIGELNERFAREEARGEAPAGGHPDGFRLLHGCELEITLDGALDYDDALLARFDVVVASLHVGRRQPRARLMKRYRVALRSPHVDVVAHPSGRRIGERPDLDLDWDALYREAAESGTLLEVNGSDERLDLDEHRVQAALEAGCELVIDSDAHWPDELGNLRWGVGIARRGWLPAASVANARPREAFLRRLRDR